MTSTTATLLISSMTLIFSALTLSGCNSADTALRAPSPDAPAPTDPRVGSLTLAVTGLPLEIDPSSALVSVSVEGSWVRVTHGAEVNLAAGHYEFRVSTGSLEHETRNPRFFVTYRAAVMGGTAVVRADEAHVLTVPYELEGGTLRVTFDTASGTAAPVLHLHRPDGRVETLVGSQTIESLPVGTYGIGVEDSSSLQPMPSFQEVQIVASELQEASVSFVSPSASWTIAGPAIRGVNSLYGSPVFDQPNGSKLVITDDVAVEVLADVRHSETKAWLDGYVVNSAVSRLDNGTIVITGGMNGSGSGVSSVYSIDPATEEVSALPPLAAGRHMHTATPLPDGRLAIIGGVRGQGLDGLRTIEVYDPAAGGTIAPMMLAEARVVHEAIAVGPNRVLVIGGLTRVPSSAAVTIELVDFEAQTVTSWGNLGREAVGARTVTVGGILYVIGGMTSHRISTIDTTTRQIVWDAAALPGARAFHAATPLPDGRIVITGGSTSWSVAESALSSVLVLDTTSGQVRAAGYLPRRVTMHAAYVSNGRTLVIGAGSSPMSAPAVPFYAAPLSAF